MNLKGNRMLPAVIIASILLAGSGTAIWLSGFQATGQIVSTATEPDYMVYELGEFDITTANSTTYFTYNNPNNEADINMTLALEVISTDELCHYTEGVDFNVQLQEVYGSYQDIANGESVVRTMQPGDTNISVRLVPNEGICPITGNITITGELV